MFDSITSNLPVMGRTFVAEIVLTTVFFMEWYTTRKRFI